MSTRGLEPEQIWVVKAAQERTDMNISYDFRLRAAESGHVLETETRDKEWLSACSCAGWSATDKIEAFSDPSIDWARHVIRAVGDRAGRPEGRISLKDLPQ